jgi:hypothetical protein
VNSVSSEWGLAAGFCEHNDEPSCSGTMELVILM